MNETVLPSASDEKLNDIFSRLLDLYERQTQERQFQIKDKEELAKTVQMLITQTKEFGQYEMGIRKRIQDCIRNSTQLSMRNIEESVCDKSNDSVKKIIENIQTSIQSVLDNTQNKKKQNIFIVIITAIISSICLGLLSIYFLMPTPTTPLTQRQLDYLKEGQLLEEVWPKLTKKEKDHLLNEFTALYSKK